MNKMKFETPNLTEKNIDKIAELFPSVITESADENGKLKKAINFDMLRQLLSEEIAEGDEAYEFTWVGKKAAIAEANKPIRKTLRPCPEESVNWDTTENLYIEGDNLEVLKLLQESYLGKVKMIYIDPPYNTGNDFIYRDDFKMSAEEYSEEIGEYDEDNNRLFRNTDSNGRFHSDWCSMIYSRLMLARNLLSDDGVIFISIDDNEQENLKKICDEVFGESNFVAECIRRTINSGKHDVTTIAPFHEYVLIYSKNACNVSFARKPKDEEERNRLYKESDEYVNERGRYYITQLNKNSLQYSDGLNYPITGPDGNEIWPGGGFDDKVWIWRWSKQKVEWGIKNGYIVFKKIDDKYKVYTKSYEFRDKDGNPINRNNPYSTLEFINKEYANFNATPELEKVFDGKKYFDFPKSITFIYEIIKLANLTHNDIVLDFFSGSATTAHAVMQLNADDGGHRKFIMVQIPEETDQKSEAYKAGYKNICEIGKERIRRAGYNILKDVASGRGRVDGTGYGMGIDNVEEYERLTGEIILDRGFRVLKLADSNMTDVYYSPAEYDQTMLDNLESNIKSDRTSLDLLFGCLLEWGLPLSMPYSSEKIEGVTVHTYNDGDLIACFDENISENAVKIIAKRKPLRAVFRDSSFADSPSKINVFEIFKLYAPDTRVKVI